MRVKLFAAFFLVCIGAFAQSPFYGMAGNAKAFRGRPISGCTPTDGQVYSYNAANADWECITVAGGPGFSNPTSAITYSQINSAGSNPIPNPPTGQANKLYYVNDYAGGGLCTPGSPGTGGATPGAGTYVTCAVNAAGSAYVLVGAAGGNSFPSGLTTGGTPPALTAGTGGVNAFLEGTAPSVGPASGVDILYADSTKHTLLLNVNNGGYLPLVQGPSIAVVSGHLAVFSGTDGGHIIDGGVAGSGVTANSTVVGGSPTTGGLLFTDASAVLQSSANARMLSGTLTLNGAALALTMPASVSNGASYMSMVTTSQQAVFGIESLSAGSIVSNSTPFAAFAGTLNNRDFCLATSGVCFLTIKGNGAVKYGGTNSTGAGSAALGANSPATVLTAPYTWITVQCGDGTTCYQPLWK